MDNGMLCYEIGEVLWSLLPSLAAEAGGAAGKVRARGFAALKARIARYYKQNRVDSRMPLRRFKLGSLKAKKHPKLKAKAGQCRRLLNFAVDLAAEFRDNNGELGFHRQDKL
jgi:hypothetical protein